MRQYDNDNCEKLLAEKSCKDPLVAITEHKSSTCAKFSQLMILGSSDSCSFLSHFHSFFHFFSSLFFSLFACILSGNSKILRISPGCISLARIAGSCHGNCHPLTPPNPQTLPTTTTHIQATNYVAGGAMKLPWHLLPSSPTLLSNPLARYLAFQRN